MVTWHWKKGAVASYPGGLLWGALVGITAHPIMWYLAIAFVYLSGARDSFGQRTLSPLSPGVFGGVFAFSFFSLLIAGIITVPVGAAAGALLVALSHRPESTPLLPGPLSRRRSTAPTRKCGAKR